MVEYSRYAHEQVSPYRDFVIDVGKPLKWLLTRALWDASGAGRRSRRQLAAVRDRHAGGKAVVVCNGPSLLKTDFELLKGVYTFGLNKINLLFDKNDFRPNCIVSVNKHVIEQNRDFYRETDIPLFLDYAGVKHVGDVPHVSYLHTIGKQTFARDCGGSLFIGGTVTYVALQLAFHMGFRRVALIGCDHSFATQGPSNKTVIAGATDHSHFDPRYFSGGVQWQLPDLVQSEISYILAREVFESAGGEIVNATEGGRLEIFRRLSLGEFIGNTPASGQSYSAVANIGDRRGVEECARGGAVSGVS